MNAETESFQPLNTQRRKRRRHGRHRQLRREPNRLSPQALQRLANNCVFRCQNEPSVEKNSRTDRFPSRLASPPAKQPYFFSCQQLRSLEIVDRLTSKSRAIKFHERSRLREVTFKNVENYMSCSAKYESILI